MVGMVGMVRFFLPRRVRRAGRRRFAIPELGGSLPRAPHARGPAGALFRTRAGRRVRYSARAHISRPPGPLPLRGVSRLAFRVLKV